MVVPPYFALVLRAFSVIEGIAMQHNGNYRIVGSCFPYLSQRLLTDDHPRMQVCTAHSAIAGFSTSTVTTQ